jgi:phosphoribosylanthranilate isomerase
MKIKVCGMKYPDNIQELAQLPVDFIGMIFYDKSPRFAGNLKQDDIKGILKTGKDKVGVFVNAGIEYILRKTEDYLLDFVQLHGNESPGFCRELNKFVPVIKAFSIAGISGFEQTKQYEGIAGYFLFDTKTPQYGGSGQKFDWNILDAYDGDTPFFLSGGITIDDIDKIKKIRHPRLYGVDLNSRFETEPGLKDIELLKQFIKQLKNE